MLVRINVIKTTAYSVEINADRGAFLPHEIQELAQEEFERKLEAGEIEAEASDEELEFLDENYESI